jgi:hypothetical protein
LALLLNLLPEFAMWAVFVSSSGYILSSVSRKLKPKTKNRKEMETCLTKPC